MNFKSMASPMLCLYPILRYFCETVLAPKGLCKAEIASFKGLCKITDAMQEAKDIRF